MSPSGQAAAADDLMRAQVDKTLAETARIERERFWIPFTISVGLVVAIVTVLPRLVG